MFKRLNQNALRTIVGVAGMLICTAACLFAATAGAHPVEAATRTQAVSIADLDLSTSQGLLVLDRRLKRAANEVCASPGIYSAFERTTRSRCIREAMEAALPHVVRALNRAAAG